MSVYPFIEAEKAQQHNAKRACELLKVSRAAYYAARRASFLPGTAMAANSLSSARIMGPGRCHDLGTTLGLLCHLGVCGGIRQAEWAGPVSLRVPAARARQPP